jgi:hypothetical protein
MSSSVGDVVPHTSSCGATPLAAPFCWCSGAWPVSTGGRWSLPEDPRGSEPQRTVAGLSTAWSLAQRSLGQTNSVRTITEDGGGAAAATCLVGAPQPTAGCGKRHVTHQGGLCHLHPATTALAEGCASRSTARGGFARGQRAAASPYLAITRCYHRSPTTAPDGSAQPHNGLRLITLSFHSRPSYDQSHRGDRTVSWQVNTTKSGPRMAMLVRHSGVFLVQKHPIGVHVLAILGPSGIHGTTSAGMQDH